MNCHKSSIGVPVSVDLFLRLTDFLREKNDERDPCLVVTEAIEYWLMNADWKPELLIDNVVTGFQWKSLFLPSGTVLRMQYKDKNFYAKVDGDRIIYDGRSVSPAAMVNEISGTSRSAWRDLWFKRPEDRDWLPARDWSKERENQIEIGEKLLSDLSL